MAKFKCNQSGNVIEFMQEHEIAEMRKHGGYTEVVVVETKEAPKTPTSSSSSKKVAKDAISISGEYPNSGN